ncbi:MAG TPA: dihydrofolate reductase family protein [Nitrospiraceae bacterium]|nr:dihydrofolate reductase family protein [Nitrospiraceae bacterium]
MQLITLFEENAGSRANILSETLSALYDGPLAFRDHEKGRPLIISNFVQTLDGIISWNIPRWSSGGAISGSNDEDRFIMALLRSCADAVMVGAGTLRDDPGHVWTPEFIYPSLGQDFMDLRRHLGKPHCHPLNVMVSGSGRIDLREKVFSTDGVKTVILTTHQGKERLEHNYGKSLAALTEACVLPGEEELDPRDIASILQTKYGADLILNEGGAQLFSAFLRAGLCDELFLTVAPQIGGNLTPRPHFAEWARFEPSNAPRMSLVTVKRPAHGGHLYFRYRF